MKRSSSSHPIKLFSAESPSSSFSDPRVNGAELKEGAAQFPPRRRPPPEPPDPATPPGLENDETDCRRLQLYQLVGHTTSHPESPTIRPPLRSLSLNSPRESPHHPQIKFFAEYPSYRSISCTKVATPIDSKQLSHWLDSRSQCTSQGSQLPPTCTPVQALSTPVSEETKPHAKSEMVLPISHLNSRSEQHLRRFQLHRAVHQPIIDHSLYVQQCIIQQGAWKIDDKVKAPISIHMGSCQHKLIDSHPVARCILDKFRRNFRAYRGDIKKRRKKSLEVAAKQCATPKGRLLPHWMDSSTERLEHAFAEQFQTSDSILGPWACRCDITTPTLAVMLFRSAFGVSIWQKHFVNSDCHHCRSCSHRVQWTLIKLKKAHDDICIKLDTYDRKPEKLSSDNCKCPTEDIAALCNDLNIIYEVFPTEEVESWLIEYPHLVEIYLQSQGIRIFCLYMQIPPFCFAVPLFESDGSRDSGSYHLLKSHFTPAVHEINRQLLIEREIFFERKSEQQNKENLGLIYPYRFGSEAECRYLHITIDTSVE